MSKTIKIMSDGNQAKVGMIIYDKSTNSIGVITHTKTQKITLNTKSGDIWKTSVWKFMIFYKPIINVFKCTLTDKTGLICCLLDDAVKATPEQKKLYWLELEKQTIEFRPEFEAKLKELGVRDQFVNNLFDPKWIEGYAVLHAKQWRNTVLSTDDWRTFINYAFYWENSPEGHKYWSNICLN